MVWGPPHSHGRSWNPGASRDRPPLQPRSLQESGSAQCTRSDQFGCGSGPPRTWRTRNNQSPLSLPALAGGLLRTGQSLQVNGSVSHPPATGGPGLPRSTEARPGGAAGGNPGAVAEKCRAPGRAWSQTCRVRCQFCHHKLYDFYASISPSVKWAHWWHLPHRWVFVVVACCWGLIFRKGYNVFSLQRQGSALREG